MAIYVDRLEAWGFKIRGRTVVSCHMFTDDLNLEPLHRMAEQIGMNPAWFQNKEKAPHYDLVAHRREQAVRLGAVEVGRHEAVAIWKARREALQGEKRPTSTTNDDGQENSKGNL